jgi:hypothetical protein
MDEEVKAALHRAKRQVLDAHGDDPDVNGAGLSFRIRGGKLFRDEPVVTVFVTRKRPEAMVSRSRLLPRAVEVDGKSWGVDVVQAGPFRSFVAPATAQAPAYGRRAEFARKANERLVGGPDAPDELTNRYLPPVQGCSISNIEDGGTAGTLGCFVTDLTDGTICVLSCNHVMARSGLGKVHEDIIQPGGLDGGTRADKIAWLKRWGPLVSGTEVDAAIAQVDNQKLGSGYSTAVANDLMAPISAAHPAVGMVVAGDFFSTFLTNMDATVTEMNVQLLGASGQPGSMSEIVAPEPFMNIEKVGRTTAYTSATIIGIGFDDIPVDVGGDVGIIEYQNLTWTLFFSQAGDSGSVACAGGSGNLKEILLFLSLLTLCEILELLGAYYDIPIDQGNNPQLSDDLRDNFLSQSMTGQLLIALTYNNTKTVTDRLNQRNGKAHNQSLAQAHATALYSKYQPIASQLLTSSSPTAVFTKSDLSVVTQVMEGLIFPVKIGGTDMLTGSEANAVESLYSQVLKPAVGMNRQQLLDYMNTQSVFETVYNTIAAVPTIKLYGTISPNPPPPAAGQQK